MIYSVVWFQMYSKEIYISYFPLQTLRKYSSLCYTVCSCWLSVLYIAVLLLLLSCVSRVRLCATP